MTDIQTNDVDEDDIIDTPEQAASVSNAMSSKVEIIGGPPAGASTLEARDACAWFGERLVLEGVNLTMPKGKVTALIGPSG